MKKLLFAIVLLLTATANVLAYDFDVDGIYYNIISNTEVEVTYSAYDPEDRNDDLDYSGDVIIPESVKDGRTTYAVTRIGGNAFWQCESLTSITIPESVTSIGDMAFFDCISLTSITISGSVTSIGEETFSCCSSLTSITLPKSVTSIGESAFCDCISLTSITLPEFVTSIGKSAFWNCTRLTKIVSLNPNPPTCGSDAFDTSIYSSATLVIPNANAYKNASVWKNFTNIEELYTLGDAIDAKTILAAGEYKVIFKVSSTTSDTGYLYAQNSSDAADSAIFSGYNDSTKSESSYFDNSFIYTLVIADDGSITITNSNDSNTPISFIMYNAKVVSESETEDGGTTDISELADNTDVATGEVRIYDLQGKRVTNPGHGVYIIQIGNTVSKVVL